MILDYTPGDLVEWSDWVSSGQWLPALITKVTHEDLGDGGPIYTTIDITLYNRLKRVLCEPEMRGWLRHKNSTWNKKTRRWIRAVPPPNAVWTHCWIENDDPGDMDQTEPLNRIGLMEITL